MISAELINNELVAKRMIQLAKSAVEPYAEALERAIGTNDLVPVNFLENGLIAAQSVCLVEYNNVASGTGFLITENLFITNNHVIRNAGEALKVELIFNFQKDRHGKDCRTTTFRLLPDTFFATSPEDALDYTVVAVEPLATDGKTPLSTFGYLPLIADLGKAISDREFLTIIQHPSGGHKRIGLRENRAIGFADSAAGPPGNQWYIEYVTDTFRGSSGSPVLNDQWQVVALHNTAVEARDANGNILTLDGSPYFKGVTDEANVVWRCNRGSRVSKIIASLQEKFPTHELLLPVFTPQLVRKESLALQPPPVPTATTPSALHTPSSHASHSPQTTHTMSSTKITFPVQFELEVRLIADQEATSSLSAGNNREKFPAGTQYEKISTSYPDYSSRNGYQADFLGQEFPIDLMAMLAELKPSLAPLLDDSADSLLHYTNFSIAIHRARRMALLTAVNIKGLTHKTIKRGKDNWILDERMSPAYQTGPEVYYKNDLDRGHMVRRQDPDWGDQAAVADQDTFHYPNSCPQHKDLNQKEWNELEDYILDATRKEKLDVTVFTGPIFSDQDRPYKDVLLPLEFYKIACMIKSNGSPSACGFVLSQAGFLDNMLGKESIGDTGFSTYELYQVPLSYIAKATKMDLTTLTPFDPLDKLPFSPKESLPKPVRSGYDISL